ncbi:MAG: PLP-dependent transferase, partial [Pseudomonadota bacterium]
VDSTVATPLLTQPIALGADFVCHSATKSLNGHSDVLAGVLLCAQNNTFWQAMRRDRHLIGSMLGSFEAHQLLRGMKTLHLRVARACANAQRVAEYLQGKKNVLRVNYPGLPSHSAHEIAYKQMHGGFGSLLSFCYDGSARQCQEMIVKLKLIKCATSLGNTESLIEHRFTVEGDTIDTPENLLRLSVGIEHCDDIINDLDAVL